MRSEKTNYLEFRKRLEETGKTYFHVSELKQIYPSSGESLKVLLSNWAAKRYMTRLGKGYWAFSSARVDYLRLACELVKSSFVSFEYALFIQGLIQQSPAMVTLATKSKSRTLHAVTWTFEYTHLKPELIFGYELSKGAYIATAEKALADTLYVFARGKRLVELDTLDRKLIRKKELSKVLKRFPSNVSAKANELGVV